MIGSLNRDFQFTWKEKKNKTSYSYFGARYYDSDLSVWLSVAPMSDQRPSHSPYNYCQWNPVMRTDPTGMLDDEYRVNSKGEIVYYKKASGTDRLYYIDETGNKKDVNGDGRMAKGTDYVEFNKSNINLTYIHYDDGTIGKAVYEFQNRNEAKNIFKFFADNCFVEAGMTMLRRGNETMTLLYTANDEGSVTDWNIWVINKYQKAGNWDVEEEYHNHPDKPNDKINPFGINSPSGSAPTRYNYAGDGDYGSWHSIAERSPNAKFFIYTKKEGFIQHKIVYPPSYYESLKKR